MSSSEYYTFLGTTCDWKCHNSVENENIFSCDNVMLDYFLAWLHIFAYFNFYKIHLVVKHPVGNGVPVYYLILVNTYASECVSTHHLLFLWYATSHGTKKGRIC